MKCPICHSAKQEKLLNLNCGRFDGSIIYPTAKIICCKKCGHIFNILTEKEIINLNKYYNKESAPINLNSPDKTGDKTGNTGPLTMERYDKLYDFMASFIKKDDRILDCGCATGGFLDYLDKKKFDKLSGFDISKRYLNMAEKRWGNKIKVGNLEIKIPFGNKTAEIVVADQVLEHLTDLKKAMREMSRVLTENGILFISVPDASRYSKNYLFDFFWFILREHIEHFDVHHLTLLAEQEGFELLKFSRYETPMMNDKMILPVLTAVFKKTDKRAMSIGKKHFNLKNKIEKYIERDNKNLTKKRNVLGLLAKSGRPTYAWGIGREFLCLYESGGLKKCNLAGLIDQNTHKQKKLSIDGIRITDESTLSNASKNSALIISAVAHKDKFKKELRKIGYPGSIIKI